MGNDKKVVENKGGKKAPKGPKPVCEVCKTEMHDKKVNV